MSINARVVGPIVAHKRLPLEFRRWSDGSQQWVKRGAKERERDLIIERVVGPKSRRKRWCIVDRADHTGSMSRYPPKVAGPFPNFRVAVVAYLLMVD